MESHARNLVVNLVVATLPAVLIGLPVECWIEAHLFTPLPLLLVVGGLIILWMEKRQYRAPRILAEDQIPLRTALGIGCIQVLSLLFPGLSRSGATIMGRPGFGLSRIGATEFSFFLAIPALLGASSSSWPGPGIFSINDLPMFLATFVVSFVVALLVIRMLLSMGSEKRLFHLPDTASFLVPCCSPFNPRIWLDFKQHLLTNPLISPFSAVWKIGS